MGQLPSVTNRIVVFSEDSGSSQSSSLLFFSEIEGDVSSKLLPGDTDSSMSWSPLVSGIVDNGFFALRTARVAEREPLERGDCRRGSPGCRLGFSFILTKLLLAADDKAVFG